MATQLDLIKQCKPKQKINAAKQYKMATQLDVSKLRKPIQEQTKLDNTK